MKIIYYLCALINDTALWVKNNHVAILVGGGIALFLVSLIAVII